MPLFTLTSTSFPLTNNWFLRFPYWKVNELTCVRLTASCTQTPFIFSFQSYFEVIIFLYLNWLLKYFFFPYSTLSQFFCVLIPCRYLELAFMFCLSPTFPRLCKFSFLNKHFFIIFVILFWSLSNSAKSFFVLWSPKQCKALKYSFTNSSLR